MYMQFLRMYLPRFWLGISVFFLGAVALQPARAAGSGETLEARLDYLYRDVPLVVQPEEVHRLIVAGAIPGDTYLLDVRSQEEWSVSRRSGAVGEALRQAGFTDVWDLYGGILFWTERGYPLVDEEAASARVHGRRRWYGNQITNSDVQVVY